MDLVFLADINDKKAERSCRQHVSVKNIRRPASVRLSSRKKIRIDGENMVFLELNAKKRTTNERRSAAVLMARTMAG